MIPFDREGVLDILRQSDTRLTARQYIRQIAQDLGLSLTQAKKILKILVERQEVAYQDLYGSTYVDISFLRPVKITDHFFLKPPFIESEAGPDEIFINILPGISFGSGHHPTTRLCLAGIDHLFFSLERPRDLSCCADIGTGSGVLAIALCLSGMASCQAWDTDANAVSEARQNIRANHLSHKIEIINGTMTPAENKCSLICANLRFPTLKQLSHLMTETIRPGGTLVLSGIREWETADLIDHYRSAGFSRIWEEHEKKWSALVLKYSPR